MNYLTPQASSSNSATLRKERMPVTTFLPAAVQWPAGKLPSEEFEEDTNSTNCKLTLWVFPKFFCEHFLNCLEDSADFWASDSSAVHHPGQSQSMLPSYASAFPNPIICAFAQPNQADISSFAIPLWVVTPWLTKCNTT